MDSKIKQSYNINEAKVLIKNNYSYELLIMAQKTDACKQIKTLTRSPLRPTSDPPKIN